MKLNYKFFRSPAILHLWIFFETIAEIAESIVVILTFTMYVPSWSLDLYEWYMDLCTPKSEDEI